MTYHTCTSCKHFYESADYCNEHHKPKNACWEPRLKWGSTGQKPEKERRT